MNRFMTIHFGLAVASAPPLCVLLAGLRKCLVQFPVFCASIHKSSPNTLVLRLPASLVGGPPTADAQGLPVVLEERLVPQEFSDLLISEYLADSAAGCRLFPDLSARRVLEGKELLLRIRITRFSAQSTDRCSSSSSPVFIGVSAAHLVADGRALARFVSLWASICGEMLSNKKSEEEKEGRQNRGEESGENNPVASRPPSSCCEMSRQWVQQLVASGAAASLSGAPTSTAVRRLAQTCPVGYRLITSRFGLAVFWLRRIWQSWRGVMRLHLRLPGSVLSDLKAALNRHIDGMSLSTNDVVLSLLAVGRRDTVGGGVGLHRQTVIIARDLRQQADLQVDPNFAGNASVCDCVLLSNGSDCPRTVPGPPLGEETSALLACACAIRRTLIRLRQPENSKSYVAAMLHWLDACNGCGGQVPKDDGAAKEALAVPVLNFDCDSADLLTSTWKFEEIRSADFCGDGSGHVLRLAGFVSPISPNIAIVIPQEPSGDVDVYLTLPRREATLVKLRILRLCRLAS